MGQPVDGFPGLQYSNLAPEACAALPLGEVGVWVLALPNDKAAAYVGAIGAGVAAKAGTPPVLLDLSADYRFNPAWQYGLTERFRGAIAASKLISNPGCYATGPSPRRHQLAPIPRASAHAARVCVREHGDGGTLGAQLTLLPLQAKLGFSAPPVVFGVSGYSGAGTSPSPKNDPVYLKDNLIPYSLTGHMHERCVRCPIACRARRGSTAHISTQRVGWC